MNQNNYYSNLSLFNNSIEKINYPFLNIISINIRSISSLVKFNKFKSLVSSLLRLPDIIVVQETWFKKDLLNIYSIPGYKGVHCCRDDAYGGVSLYISEDLKFSVHSCKSVSYTELISVSLPYVRVNGKPLVVVAYYRSQKCLVADFLSLIEEDMELLSGKSAVVLGDTNIDQFSSDRFKDLENFFLCYDCHSCHRLMTRPASFTSIDHVFCNEPGKLYVDAVVCELTDHNLISCKIRCDCTSRSYVEKTSIYCDMNRVRHALDSRLSVDFNSFGANDGTKIFVDILSSSVTEATKETRYRKLLQFELTPWVNRNLQNLILYKQKLLRLRRRSKDFKYGNTLRLVSNIVRKASRLSRKNYYRSCIMETGGDQKKCWMFLNKALGRKTTRDIDLYSLGGVSVDDDQEKAICFNSYFINSVRELRRNMVANSGDHWNGLGTLGEAGCRFILDEVDNTDILEVINSLDRSSSPGYDLIRANVVKECRNLIISPMVVIFNKIFQSSIYPDTLKICKIVPVPKTTNAKSVQEYRPISILPIVDKILEKIIYRKLVTFLDTNNLLYNYQFGFRKGCGTEEAVVNVVNFICMGLDCGLSGVAGLFLDFSKAFDLVDHDILLDKLSCYGVCGSELLLFKSFLSRRIQYVEVCGAKSDMTVVDCGVPQGSCLGPLLFLIYLNDLSNLKLSGRLFMYADDVSLFYPYKDERALRMTMERDASLIMEYARLNKLALNTTKTKVIRFRPHCNVAGLPFSIVVGGDTIEEVCMVRYLGLTFQSNLSWDTHISGIRKKIAPAIGILNKMKYIMDTKTKLCLYRALVQSHLDYLVSIYGYRNSTTLKTLQAMQNRAIKAVFRLPPRFPTERLYSNICKSVLPIHTLYKYKLLLYVFKVLHSLGYHTITFSQNQTAFSTRNQHDLRVVRCRLELTKQRIEFIGSFEFNQLPQNIKFENRISNFKVNLKAYLQNN